MGHYYFECKVSYRDNGTIEKYENYEMYSFIIEANKRNAKKEAKNKARNLFIEDMGQDLNQILSVHIDVWYETTEYARAS